MIQEAVCTGDPEMVQLVLQHRDMQRYTQRTEGVPGLLKRLTEVKFKTVTDITIHVN